MLRYRRDHPIFRRFREEIGDRHLTKQVDRNGTQTGTPLKSRRTPGKFAPNARLICSKVRLVPVAEVIGVVSGTCAKTPFIVTVLAPRSTFSIPPSRKPSTACAVLAFNPMNIIPVNANARKDTIHNFSATLLLFIAAIF